MLQYQGTCVDIDTTDIFDFDATQFAYMVEESIPLSYENFITICNQVDNVMKSLGLNKYDLEFGCYPSMQNVELAFAYDTMSDVHYIWA